jgi:hypothetical protein
MNERVQTLDGEILPPPQTTTIYLDPYDADFGIRPLDRGALWIWFGLGVAIGTFWTGLAWALWAVLS